MAEPAEKQGADETRRPLGAEVGTRSPRGEGGLTVSAGPTVAAAVREEREAEDRCPLCGARDATRRFPGIRAGDVEERARTGAYRITSSERRLIPFILRCSSCGLSYLPAAWRRSGRSTYESGADPEYLESESDRRLNARRLLEMLPSRGRLLDVGCAYGLLLRAARELGFDPHGLEPSHEMAAVARASTGFPIDVGFLEDVAPMGPPYDVIVMADVFEHLEDPLAGLARARDLLARGGRILLLTPDVGSLAARLAGPGWWGLLDDHNFYFDRRTLRSALARTGFEVEILRSFGRRLPLGVWASKLRPYGARWSTLGESAVRLVGLSRTSLTVNFGDQMVCLARRVQ